MLISANQIILDGLQGADPAVHSKFYQSASEYYKVLFGFCTVMCLCLKTSLVQVNGPAETYYKNALMYLAYTPLDTLTLEQKQVLATDLALAALTGENVFNFGEVVRSSFPITLFC